MDAVVEYAGMVCVVCLVGSSSSKQFGRKTDGWLGLFCDLLSEAPGQLFFFYGCIVSSEGGSFMPAVRRYVAIVLVKGARKKVRECVVVSSSESEYRRLVCWSVGSVDDDEWGLSFFLERGRRRTCKEGGTGR